MLPTIFELATEYRRITDVLMDAGVDEQTLRDTLEAESWPLELKATNYGFVIRNLEATAEGIKAAEKQMKARRETIERRVQALTELLKTAMEIASISRIETPHFALSIKKNPASVDIFEPGLIPAEFMRQPEPPPAAPDKAAIKAALQDGKDVPGALLAQGTRLEIK